MAIVKSNSITFIDNTGVEKYLYIKYSDDGVTFTENNGLTPGGWLGTCTTNSSIAPMSFDSYTWSKIKGTDGQDAITYYTWIKYADDENGTNMSDSPDNKSYMGIAYNKETSSESNVATDYIWSLIKGTNGIDGNNGITYYTWIKYADDGIGNGISDDPTDKKYIGIAYNKTDSNESADPDDYAWSLFKGADGIDGQNGAAGNGIKSIREYYLISSSNTGITIETNGWSTEVPTLDKVNKYLWNYEETEFTTGEVDTTEPVVIGVYGDSIASIINYYAVTSDLITPNKWIEGTPPAISSINKYLWNYEKITYTDNTFTETIPAIIGVHGDNGIDAITFQIYSSQGFIFKEDMDQIELKVISFKGADAITDATYTWSWLNNDSGMYTEIVSNSTEPSIIINKTDDYALASLKCVMTYNNKTYEDYITLSNETIIYTSMVKFFDGNNIFASNDLYIVAYVEMYRNNDREETIATTTYCSGVSTVSQTGEIFSSLTGEFSDGDQIYFICQNDDGLYEVVLGQYVSGVWNVIDNNLQYTYTNTLYPNINSNVLAISKESINKSQNIDFMIYKDGVHVSSTSANVIDSNDPIVSNTTPKNPDYNQLWLDTSTVPYTLKIFTKVEGEEIGRWIDCAQQIGEAIHTSKPSIYKKGDLWILADNERCGDFGPGSMLKSTNNSDQFSETHWVDAASSLTATITNIRESFTWDERGIQIAKRVTASNGNITNPFYVHIDSTRMGFHSVTYKENGAQDRDVEVVHIGYNSATIQNATFEGSNGTTFDNDATFNKQINMNGIDKNGSSVGFVWKIETNGSLSLALSN